MSKLFVPIQLWGRLATCGRLAIGQLPLTFDAVCGLPVCGAVSSRRQLPCAPVVFVGQPILAAAGFQPARFAHSKAAVSHE
jgi:hypothetical protein